MLWFKTCMAISDPRPHRVRTLRVGLRAAVTGEPHQFIPLCPRVACNAGKTMAMVLVTRPRLARA